MNKSKGKDISDSLKKDLSKKHYALAGSTSAVQICNWTKNSLNKKGVCWKEKFYGIQSHRCCQMSPCVMWCENKCLHCWRPIEDNLGTDIPVIDDPKKIIEEIIKQRIKLLNGFGGNERINKKRLKESLEPNLFTFSLSGEPTLYPRLGELIKELRKRKIVTFIVTNGQNSQAIKKLEKEKALPTQLTVSLNAPNEKLFTIWHRSSKPAAWKEFNKTLELLKELKNKTRKVIRLTLVKSIQGKNLLDKISNMGEETISEYAHLIKKADPDFIHVKAFMSLGYSRERMGYEKMPEHYEIKRFAEKLLQELKSQGSKEYKILGDEKRSRVVLIGKSRRGLKIKKA